MNDTKSPDPKVQVAGKGSSWAAPAEPETPYEPPQHRTLPKHKEEHQGASDKELDEFCYVLHSADTDDEKAAQEWRKANGAKFAKAKVVSEIKLTRLTERHTVIALFRPEGSIELKAGAAVSAGDHWRKEGEDGAVDTRMFLGALAKTCLPALLKIRRDNDDDMGTLKLGYA